MQGYRDLHVRKLRQQRHQLRHGVPRQRLPRHPPQEELLPYRQRPVLERRPSLQGLQGLQALADVVLEAAHQFHLRVRRLARQFRKERGVDSSWRGIL